MEKMKIFVALFISSLMIMLPGSIASDASNSDVNDIKVAHAILNNQVKERLNDMQLAGQITAQEKSEIIKYLNTKFWEDYDAGKFDNLISNNFEDCSDPQGSRQQNGQMSMDSTWLIDGSQPSISTDYLTQYPGAGMLAMPLRPRLINGAGVGGAGEFVLGIAAPCIIVWIVTYAGCMQGCNPEGSPEWTELGAYCVNYCTSLANRRLMECLSGM